MKHEANKTSEVNAASDLPDADLEQLVGGKAAIAAGATELILWPLGDIARRNRRGG